MDHNIFVSIGTPSTKEQKEALDSLIGVMESRGLQRRSPMFSHKTPLISIRETLDECDGMIVIAYPRILVEHGLERPKGSNEKELKKTAITTPWNHIEAAFAYERGLPLMVLRDSSVKIEGFVEFAYDWEVKEIEFSKDYMESTDFARLITAFARQVDDYKSGRWKRFSGEAATGKEEPSVQEVAELKKLSIRETLSKLNWSEGWKLLVVIAAVLSGTFYAGHKIGMYFYGAG